MINAFVAKTAEKPKLGNQLRHANDRGWLTTKIGMAHTGFFFEMLRRNYVFEVSSLDQNEMKTHLL
jgi:hypothetical protein